MKNQMVIQTLLQKKLMELQAKNPSFSLRAFARKVGVSPTTVSRVLNGERAVSGKLARRLCDALLLDPQDRSEVLGQFPDRSHYRRQRVGQKPGVASGEVLAPNYLQLSADQFRVIGEWYYYGILSLLKTRGFKNDPTWIASRLGIGTQDAEVAIDRMKRLGILTETPEGGLARQANQYRTSDDVADLSVRKSHFQTLELAHESLERDPVTARDFTHLTFPCDPSLLPEIKVRIRQFQDDLDKYVAERSNELSEVYRLSCQFVPLTRLSPNPSSSKTEIKKEK